MLPRIIILIAVLAQVSGCVIVPNMQMADRIDFNYAPPDQPPMSYDDLLCCTRCKA